MWRLLNYPIDLAFFTLKGFFFSNKTCGSGNLRESNKCQKIWVVTLQDQTNPAIVHSYPMNIPWISQSYSTIKKPGSHWSFCQAFFWVTSTVLTHTRDADRFESLPSKVGNMLDVEMTLIWPGYRCSDITTVGMAFIQNHLVLFHDFYASLGWQKKNSTFTVPGCRAPYHRSQEVGGGTSSLWNAGHLGLHEEVGMASGND